MPVHVFAWPSAKDATTAPVVGLIVNVPSELETEDTAPPLHAEPVPDKTPPENVAQPEAPVSTMSLAPKVCAALHVCARLSSATWPVFAGKNAVAEPSAAVTGSSVTVPDVYPPNMIDPFTPDEPRDRAAPDMLAFVVAVPETVVPVDA